MMQEKKLIYHHGQTFVIDLLANEQTLYNAPV